MAGRTGIAVACLLALTSSCALFVGDEEDNRDFRRVFLTSEAFTGDLVSAAGTGDDGLGSGDAICNELASVAGLGGEFVAWLSSPAQDAFNRVSVGSEWRLTDDDTVVFPDRDAILAGPAVAIQLDEAGDTMTPQDVWTATSGAGTHVLPDCDQWADGTADSMGYHGRTDDLVDNKWTLKADVSCEGTARLYCFER